MDKFTTGDRVYQARVGTVFMDQVFGDKPHCGVQWDGTDVIEYAEPVALTRLNDLSRFILKTIAEDNAILAEICPPSQPGGGGVDEEVARELEEIAKELEGDDPIQSGHIIVGRNRLRAQAIRNLAAGMRRRSPSGTGEAGEGEEG